ncbi:MAG: hypothetical protein V1747_03240 [Candidatus Omnitrophota bacterium]
MNIFEGQIRNAKKAYEWRSFIPNNLKNYLDFRSKATGITLVSLFDFAPMRGINVNSDNIKFIMETLTKEQDFLLSPNKDDDKKRAILEKLKFKSRLATKEEYLEEDVQAFLVREILSSENNAKNIAQKIIEECKLSSLKYLASEFEWSEQGKKDRVDILCCDGGDYNKLLIIELKKVRTTKLEQARYLKIFKEHETEIKKFVAVLTGKEVDACRTDIKIIYLMPSHPRLDKNMWVKVIKEQGVDGIIFYNTGYPFDCAVFEK